MANQQDQLATHLLQNKSLPVSSAWLQTFLTTQQRNIHISALTQTAFFRILNSDIRESLTSRNPSSILPVDIFAPTVQERRLTGPIPLQVLDIEDIGTSIWNQVEAIERVERGEAVRGREIVRTVNLGDDDQDGTNTRPNGTANAGGANANASDSNGPHRLILQDAKGTRAVGIEMARIIGVGVNTLPIGAKLTLRNATVARGMILLTPESVTLLGGKIEAMDKAWKTGRKARLLEKITSIGGENA